MICTYCMSMMLTNTFCNNVTTGQTKTSYLKSLTNGFCADGCFLETGL
uniref:Uncharacterized protein n=1 Tax=Anguilla anguilla TaxID=7936 RepID=A0A0E9TT16_ANGAN